MKKKNKENSNDFNFDDFVPTLSYFEQTSSTALITYNFHDLSLPFGRGLYKDVKYLSNWCISYVTYFINRYVLLIREKAREKKEKESFNNFNFNNSVLTLSHIEEFFVSNYIHF